MFHMNELNVKNEVIFQKASLATVLWYSLTNFLYVCRLAVVSSIFLQLNHFY